MTNKDQQAVEQLLTRAEELKKIGAELLKQSDELVAEYNKLKCQKGKKRGRQRLQKPPREELSSKKLAQNNAESQSKIIALEKA